MTNYEGVARIIGHSGEMYFISTVDNIPSCLFVLYYVINNKERLYIVFMVTRDD